MKTGPITELTSSARRMLYTNIYGSPKSKETIKEFYKMANDNDMQGQALIALQDAKRSLEKEISDKNFTEGVLNTIEARINGDEALKTLNDDFFMALKAKYPKTLEDRVELTRHNRVVVSEVQPLKGIKNKFNKFIVSVKKMIREE